MIANRDAMTTGIAVMPHETAARRTLALTVVAAGAAALLLAVVLVRMIGEAGGTNSYALVAESFLTGTPWASGCFDGDCAEHGGHVYVVFPPLPGVIAMPLVALFGTETRGFIALGLLASAAGLVLWWRSLQRLEVHRDLRVWLVAALGFASPVYYVTLRSEGVWFFAQALAFAFLAAAIERCLAGRLVASGLALAAALLCRQMSVFYAPLLLILALPSAEPLVRIDRHRLGMALSLAVPVAAAVLCYLAYNAWRFGDPFESGYRYIVFTDPNGMLKNRWDGHGLWSIVYVPYNLVYLLLQGFHAEFAPPDGLRITGLDPGGTSILAASPWLLFLFFTPLRRTTVMAALLVLGFALALLFYHSNGFSQYNTQRYALDWMPAALLMLAAGLRLDHLPMLRLLVTWGIVLNVATVAVLALTHAAG
jgi:hypothetical protein